MKKGSWIVLVVVILLMPACYYKVEIDEAEVGLILPDGVTVQEVVRSGRYTDMGYYAEMKQVDVSAKTYEWTDPDVVTKDKQQVGFTVGLTYRRSSDTESILHMWTTYRSECVDDGALQAQVSNRTARVVKNVSAQYSLDQMLGVSADDVSRVMVQADIRTGLSIELEEIGVELLDVGINNISPSESYRARLEEKADAAAQVEIASQRTLQAEEKLKQVVAETEIELELARRERLIAEEQNEVFEQSPLAYELEKMKIMSQMLGSNDKIIFVPTGENLSLLLGGNVVPVN